MLKLTILGTEIYDEINEVFSTTGDVVLELEHSLVSLSKWESEYKKPFLGRGEKTAEEIVGYIRAMVISPDFNSEVLFRLSKENIQQINDYIEDKQSATTFGAMPEQRGKGETITSELIYYWMVAFNIPFECQHWHLNRLFSLIRICNVKNQDPKKVNKKALAQRNAELNEQRKAQLGTSG